MRDERRVKNCSPVRLGEERREDIAKQNQRHPFEDARNRVVGPPDQEGANYHGISSLYWTPGYAVVIGSFLIWWSYYTIARIFKWMTLILFCYVLAAFFAKPDWGAVLHATFVPHFEWSAKYWATLVGIFGTTISPYLFFWQASQEVEEERKQGELTLEARKGASD